MVVAMNRLIFRIALVTVSLVAWAQPMPQGPSGAYGQDRSYGQDQGQDDPADAAQHGVARLSLVNGSVSVTRGDSGESVAANMNEPLVAADRISTGQGSRAELQFDSVNMIRVGGNSDVRIGDLQYHRYFVQINQGTTLYRMLSDSDAQVELSTPSVSIVPLRQGIYRITVRPDGSSEITVRAGEADLISSSGRERLPAGQTVLSRGSANDAEIMTVAALPYDEWDRWNTDRDRFFEREQDVSRYAGPDIEGAGELSNYGRWNYDPAYGNVWVPSNVGSDWAPYRDGRWDYLNYYGWSWVSYDPWGWAPYHYGNWYRSSFGWAWYPGAIGQRHYWRPAMVGFFGFGSPSFGASLGFGYGNVGWVPLAPHERFRPWYGRGYSGGRNVNIVNNTNIGSVYRNARINGAVTGLRAGDFGRVGVGRNGFVRPNSGDLARAGIVNGGVPVAPGRNFNSTSVGRFNNNIVRLGGSVNTPSNTGGWRRLDSRQSAPPMGGSRSDVRMFSAPRERPQPVRISPSIVNSRANDGNAPRSGFGGFGGPRPSGGPGFGAPPVQQQAPQMRQAPEMRQAPQIRQAPSAPRNDSGAFRGPQSGGGARGNGGGNRGGGGPHGRGRRD